MVFGMATLEQHFSEDIRLISIRDATYLMEDVERGFLYSLPACSDTSEKCCSKVAIPNTISRQVKSKLFNRSREKNSAETAATEFTNMSN